MKLTDLFLDELEREAVVTRRALERVPDGRDDWQPHQKSMKLGDLATLVASMPSWIDMVVNHDELDLNPPGGKKYEAPKPRTSAERVQVHEDAVVQARKVLRNTSDEHLMTKWRLLIGGTVVEENARYVVLRDSVFNHLAHHRGQLTVYLRLNEASVPAIYGASADEKAA